MLFRSADSASSWRCRTPARPARASPLILSRERARLATAQGSSSSWHFAFGGQVCGGTGAGESGEEAGRPFDAGAAQEVRGEVARPMLGKDDVDPLLRIGIRGAAQRERDRAEAELEQSVAARRLEIILALDRKSTRLNSSQ